VLSPHRHTGHIDVAPQRHDVRISRLSIAQTRLRDPLGPEPRDSGCLGVRFEEELDGQPYHHHPSRD
jgi:hypothetical protein